MKICVISDLHGYLPKLEPCELVLICGDIVSLDSQSSISACKKWYLQEFMPWVNNLKCSKVIFIPGNHEVGIERKEHWYKQTFSNSYKATILIDKLYEYISSDCNVYKIYGTPYCKIFGDWAYMRSSTMLKEKFSNIPYLLDILITHDVAYGYADQSLQDIGYGTEEHFGTIELRDAILEKKPKYHFSGHIHSAEHKLTMIGETKHYNVSLLNERYNPIYKPLYLDI